MSCKLIFESNSSIDLLLVKRSKVLSVEIKDVFQHIMFELPIFDIRLSKEKMTIIMASLIIVLSDVHVVPHTPLWYY